MKIGIKFSAALLLINVVASFGSAIVDPKVASAADLCQLPKFEVRVDDVTDPNNIIRIGTFQAGNESVVHPLTEPEPEPNSNPYPSQYDINVQPGHIIRYTRHDHYVVGYLNNQDGPWEWISYEQVDPSYYFFTGHQQGSTPNPWPPSGPGINDTSITTPAFAGPLAIYSAERKNGGRFGWCRSAHPGDMYSSSIVIVVHGEDAVPVLNCAVNQVVTQGQTANFSLSAENMEDGYNNNIDVTMSSDPTGPTMVTSPVVLGPNNNPLPYHNIARVQTTSLAPDTYNLTFNADDGVNTIQPCHASLTVEPALHVDLLFNGQQGPTQPNPSTGSTGQLSWEVRGATRCVGAMEQGVDTTPASAGGPWTGPRDYTQTTPSSLHNFDVSGMQSGDYTFRISCYDSSGEEDIDTVRVNVGQVNSPTLRLWCSGEGNSQTNTDGGEPDTCHIYQGRQAMLYWDSAYTTSCSMNPYLGYQIPTVNLEGDSTGNLQDLGDHPYTATCPGAPGTDPAVKTVHIIVDPRPSGGSGPSSVDIAPSACGQIVVSWNNPRTSGNHPDSFNVYRRTSPSAEWSLDPNGTNIPYSDVPVDGAQYIYTDRSPLSLTSSNYYMVKARYGGVESAGVVSYPLSVIPSSCSPSLSLSDKDLYRVEGSVTNNFIGAVACSGISEPASVPNNGIFAVDDTVFFQINICNSGNQPMTGIRLHDTMYNLTNPKVISVSPSGCVVRQTLAERSADFTLADIAAAPPTKFCTIKMSAKVTAPTNPSAAVYRFQNVVDVTADGGLTAHLFTPPYLFSLLGGVPNRNETGPQ